MGSKLEDLPTELIERIAKCCFELHSSKNDVDSLLNFRRTSRTVEAATRHFWWDACFESRHLDLDLPSLKRVKAIGQVPEFAQKVRTLTIRSKDDSCRFDQSEDEDEDGILLIPENQEGSPTHTPDDLLNLSFAAALTLQNLKNLANIVFVPDEAHPGEERTARGYPSIDFSETFNFLLLAVHECGIHPQHISFHPGEYTNYERDFKCAFDSGISQLSPCFSTLKSFSARIEVAGVDDLRYDEIENARQMSAGLNMMKSLSKLSLVFATGSSRHAAPSVADIPLFFQEMATSVHLPCLDVVEFSSLQCHVEHLTRFMIRHKDTVNTCSLQCVASVDQDGLSHFRTLLETLRDSCDLETLDIRELELAGDPVEYILLEFPGVELPCACRPCVSGMIHQHNPEIVEFKGQKEVHKGLNEMIKCIGASEL